MLQLLIGTNIGLTEVIGNILQDEKLPGIHIAFGNPYGAHTGADWYSSTHIDVVGRQSHRLGNRVGRVQGPVDPPCQVHSRQPGGAQLFGLALLMRSVGADGQRQERAQA